jgi:hypothetical protein
MNIELILIILLGILLFAFMGIALHLARTIEQMRQYITELERDMRSANIKLMEHYYDSAADHQ